MERECKDLDQRIEVYIDDKKMELPSIESIVVLNIPSWGAGVDLWNMNLEGKNLFTSMCIRIRICYLNSLKFSVIHR